MINLFLLDLFGSLKLARVQLYQESKYATPYFRKFTLQLIKESSQLRKIWVQSTHSKIYAQIIRQKFQLVQDNCWQQCGGHLRLLGSAKCYDKE